MGNTESWKFPGIISSVTGLIRDLPRNTTSLLFYVMPMDVSIVA